MKRLILAFTCLFLAVPCQARVIIVDANGTGDYPTIQAAIDDANDGDIIELQPGTYTGPGNRSIDFLGKAITVKSENGPEDCIIDVNLPDIWTYPLDPNGHRGFYFHQAESINSVLQGVTIINGCITGSDLPPLDPNDPWPIGAGIFCQSASPTIIDCVIRHCACEVGGGIGCMSAAPVIVNCTVTNCYAGGFGWCESGGFGGGIGLIEGCDAKIIGCTIKNNEGYYNSKGGGVFCTESSAEVKQCAIYGNGAEGNLDGGGVYCGTGSNVTLENCVIAQNYTEHGDGGGLYCYKSSSRVSNSIVWYNEGAQLVFVDPCENAVVYSNVQGGWLGTGNIDTDPCFADPCNGDYHLKSQAGRWDPNSQSWVQDAVTSPCIDAGDPNSDWSREPYPNGGRINIGAYGGTAQASMGACFPYCHPDYQKWLAAGELLGMPAGRGPECWCYPRQCHGDADGDWVGTFIGRSYVNPLDLAIFASAWKVLEPPKGVGIVCIPDGICCDFAHDKTGSRFTGYTYVGPTDLAIFAAYWKIYEPPHGPGIPPDCLDCP